MMGLVTLRTVSLVVQPSMTIMTHDTPKPIFGVTPPLQDGFPVECDFANCFVEKYLAPCVTQDGDREEIVEEAGESMC